MGKRQIRIREALADVRSGMTDAELMEKYNLAAKGLQSLFAKLIETELITLEELERRMPGFMESALLATDREQEAWKIRRRKPSKKSGQVVGAREAVSDIKSGMSDSDLMHKYKLTSRGLQDLFDQLIAADLIGRMDLEQRNAAADSTVDLREMTGELDFKEMLKSLEEDSPTESDPADITTSSIEILLPESRKPEPAKMSAATGPPKALPDPEQVLRDVRSGLTDAELMDKYRVTYLELDKIFTRLLDTHVATRGELYGRSSFFAETVAVYSSPNPEGHYLAFPIPISDAMDPKVMGRLRTVGETEVGTVGIEAEVEQYRTLVIFPEKFVDIEPITFDAMCVWSQAEPEGNYATFRIAYITQRDLSRLRNLVKSLTLGD